MGRRIATVAVLVGVLLGATVTAWAQQAGPSTRYAFVARGDDPVDALAAAPVAGRLDAPLVLTRSGTLVAAAREALVAADPDVVVLAGARPALSEDVRRGITAALPEAEVRRVGGANRYETARSLAALLAETTPAFAYRDGAGVPETVDGEAVGQWVFADVQVRADSLGDFAARARVTNTGDAVDVVFWTITVFRRGTVVGTASASATDVASDDTITVEFVSSEDYQPVDAWDIQVDGQD